MTTSAAIYDAPPRSGTVPLRISTVDIDLEEIGYPGWTVTMRTNPRASVYDDFLVDRVEDMPRWWTAFGRLVHTWNFADEDGQPFPVPAELESERDLDLPIGIIAFIYRRYLEEFRARVGLPKVPDANSATFSTTSDAPVVDE